MIIATEALRLLPQYCIGIFYYNKHTASLNICAIRNCNWYENFSIGMNLWVSLLVFSTNLISALYWSI